MKFRFFLFLIATSLAYDYVQAEQGVEQVITLTKSREEHIVKFKNEFIESPIIYITISKLAIKNSQEDYGFEIEISDVTTTDFKLIYLKYNEHPIIVQVQWLAIFDPRIEIVYYTTFKSKMIIPVYENNFSYSIIGMKGNKNQAGVKVTSVENGQAHLKVTTNLKMVKICVISGSKNVMNTKLIPFSTQKNHPWLKQNKGKAFINFSFDLKQQNPLLIGGITEFLFKSNEMKIELKNLQFKDKVTAEIGTWNEALLSQASVSILAYTVDNDLILSDKNCVELFEQCYFQGKSIKLCNDGQQQKLEEQFTFKSFIVPRFKEFELVANDGAQKIFGIESCIDEIILE